MCLSVSGQLRVNRFSLSDNESFDFLICTHTLSSELLLSFTSGNVMASEVADLGFLPFNAVAPVVNLCASPSVLPVLALLLSWFVASCIMLWGCIL